MSTRPYDYVAYIDESGDPGLKAVKPLDANGSSEWLVLGAMMVSADREAETLEWAKRISTDLRLKQRSDLHFRDLTPLRKRLLCQEMADLRAAYFVVASNKKNMKGHKNPFAAAKGLTLVGAMPNYNWFYYWVSRILLEKLSHYALRRSMHDHGEPRKIKLVFSENKSLRYDELGFYYDLLRWHSNRGTQFIKYDEIDWEVMSRDLLTVRSHHEEAGLQFADAVAGAFFSSCDVFDRGGGCDPEFARLLKPKLPEKRGGGRAGYSVKLIPSLEKAKLLPEQAQIFLDYGYRRD